MVCGEFQEAIWASFKRRSGTFAGTARRVLRTKVPVPFLRFIQIVRMFAATSEKNTSRQNVSSCSRLPLLSIPSRSLQRHCYKRILRDIRLFSMDQNPARDQESRHLSALGLSDSRKPVPAPLCALRPFALSRTTQLASCSRPSRAGPIPPLTPSQQRPPASISGPKPTASSPPRHGLLHHLYLSCQSLRLGKIS